MLEAAGNRIAHVTGKWWLLLLRGLAAIAVAVVAFMRPGDALVALVLVLGFYAFLAGVFAIVAAFSGAGGDHWWALLLEGIIAIVAAFIVWSWPIVSTLAFVYFVAAWLIVSGIFQVAAGIRLRDMIPNEWLYILGGVVSVGFGVWIFRSIAFGVLATAYLLGWYFLFFGIVQVALAMRVRSFHAALTQTPKAA